MNLKKIATSGLLVLASFTTSFTVGQLAMRPATAAVQAPTWTQRTCSAFSRWEAKPTTANLDKLVTFSLHLPRGYLQADVLELAADALDGQAGLQVRGRCRPVRRRGLLGWRVGTASGGTSVPPLPWVQGNGPAA